MLRFARRHTLARAFSERTKAGAVMLPLQDFPKLRRAKKAFEQELIGTKSEEELFNESRRALSASAANRRTHVYIRETVTTRIFRNQTNRPGGR
jgi:hypothetical protein